jgi:hypothetical protein
MSYRKERLSIIPPRMPSNSALREEGRGSGPSQHSHSAAAPVSSLLASTICRGEERRSEVMWQSDSSSEHRPSHSNRQTTHSNSFATCLCCPLPRPAALCSDHTATQPIQPRHVTASPCLSGIVHGFSSNRFLIQTQLSHKPQTLQSNLSPHLIGMQSQ